MKALITGGAGFIGSHLAERLVLDGHDVCVLDDLSTGSLANLHPVSGNPHFHHQLGSVTDEGLVLGLIDRADVVFHLAAAVGVKLIIDRPTQTIETNVRGAEVVLSAATKKGKLVLLTSTSEVYGKAGNCPLSEDDDVLLGPTSKSRWSYACSKAIDEYLALAYSQERGLPVIIVRLFNTVGPRQTGRYGMVVPSFVVQGIGGRDITVYGDGEQTRCFADVSEVVECLIRLVRTPESIGKVLNVGSNNEISVNTLAKVVRDRTGGRSRIVHLDYRDAYAEGFEDLRRRVPNLARLEQTIGFRPTRPIEAIVDDVIKHELSSP